MSVAVRRTQRLLMRGFTDADRQPFAALNADPIVMERFQSTMTREATDGFIDQIEACWAERGWRLRAIEVLPKRRPKRCGSHSTRCPPPTGAPRSAEPHPHALVGRSRREHVADWRASQRKTAPSRAG